MTRFRIPEPETCDHDVGAGCKRSDWLYPDGNGIPSYDALSQCYLSEEWRERWCKCKGVIYVSRLGSNTKPVKS